MIVMGLIRRYSGKDRIAVLAAIATVSILLGSVFALYYKAITLLIGKDPTLTGRTDLWKSVVISGMKHPFLGFGYDAFWSVMQGEVANIAFAMHWAPMYAHNGFLDVWLTLGALGLAMVVYSMLRALRDAFICLSREWTPFVGWYLCIIVLTILYNLSEGTLMRPNNLGWVMYVMACVGLNNEKRRVRGLRIQ
jgi:O-antigen ligase